MTIFTPIQSFNKAWSKRYYDTGITGKVDFYVGHGNTTYLWAKAKEVLLCYKIIKPNEKVARFDNFCYFCTMTRKIRTYGGYFESFMATLTEKEQEKVQYGLLLLKTQGRLPKKFVKLIREGIYELRTEYGGKIYRVFFIFDEGNIMVLFNGFQKKAQKTPQGEIDKAIKIKEAYYADKQSQNR